MICKYQWGIDTFTTHLKRPQGGFEKRPGGGSSLRPPSGPRPNRAEKHERSVSYRGRRVIPRGGHAAVTILSWPPRGFTRRSRYERTLGQNRLWATPVLQNYRDLTMNFNGVFWVTRPAQQTPKTSKFGTLFLAVSQTLIVWRRDENMFGSRFFGGISL